MIFEFLIPQRPVSLSTRPRENLQKWKKYVYNEAKKTWNGIILRDQSLHLCLVYLCDNRAPGDTDNIIKPIQDALIGLVYEDDILVTDVELHRRPFVGTFDVSKIPSLLVEGIALGKECVYVRVSDAGSLEEYL